MKKNFSCFIFLSFLVGFAAKAETAAETIAYLKEMCAEESAHAENFYNVWMKHFQSNQELLRDGKLKEYAPVLKIYSDFLKQKNVLLLQYLAKAPANNAKDIAVHELLTRVRAGFLNSKDPMEIHRTLLPTYQALKRNLADAKNIQARVEVNHLDSILPVLESLHQETKLSDEALRSAYAYHNKMLLWLISGALDSYGQETGPFKNWGMELYNLLKASKDQFEINGLSGGLQLEDQSTNFILDGDTKIHGVQGPDFRIDVILNMKTGTVSPSTLEEFETENAAHMARYQKLGIDGWKKRFAPQFCSEI